jgi:hypothetical protein
MLYTPCVFIPKLSLTGCRKLEILLNERTTDWKFYQNSAFFIYLNGWEVTESGPIHVTATTTAGL